MSIKENSIITKKDLRKNWLTWLSICCPVSYTHLTLPTKA